MKRRIYGLVGLTWLTSKCLGNSLTHETRGGDTPWEISNKTSWRDTVAQAVFFFPHWKLIWTLPNNHDNHIYIIYIVYIYISGLQTMVTKVLICARPKLEHPPTSRREPPSLVLAGALFIITWTVSKPSGSHPKKTWRPNSGRCWPSKNHHLWDEEHHEKHVLGNVFCTCFKPIDIKNGVGNPCSFHPPPHHHHDHQQHFLLLPWFLFYFLVYHH